jgi:Ca2+-transporting ATPase
MILWINLVTDSLPALALGVEKVEKDIMNRPPRKAGQSLFAGHTGKNIIIQGLWQTVLTMTSFCVGGYVLGGGVFRSDVAMTMAFLTLSLIQLFHSYNSRSQTHSLFASNPFSNKMINYAFLAGLALTAMTFIPAFQTFMGTTMLSGKEFLIAIGCALAIIPFVEIQKFVENLLRKKKDKRIENFKQEQDTKLEEQD